MRSIGNAGAWLVLQLHFLQDDEFFDHRLMQVVVDVDIELNPNALRGEVAKRRAYIEKKSFEFSGVDTSHYCTVSVPSALAER